jgi:rifampicin phosphotransferase
MPEVEKPNLLHMSSGPRIYWTTGNVAEAAPGVHTPLGWSIWGGLTEDALAATNVDLGARPHGYRSSPNADERFGSIFYGRYSANVNTFRALGDRMPGTSGDAVEEQFFGEKQTGERNRPVRSRYPVVVAKLPGNIIRPPRQVARYRAENYTWWSQWVFDRPPTDLDGGVALLREGAARYVPVMRAHMLVTLLAQGLFDQLAQLCLSAGMQGRERTLVSGYGGMEEAAVVADVRAMAHGLLTEHEFLRRHGYHGRSEGDISSRSWRENPAPIRALAASYRKADADPLASSDKARQAREHTEHDLRTGLPRWRRPAITPTLALARRFVLGREVGKAGFLLAMDGMRAGARAIGAAMARRGLLSDPEDVFFLTIDELLGDPNRDRREQIAERRAIYTRYRELDIPETWQGDPIPVPIKRQVDDNAERVAVVRGMGVSAGIVLGEVNIVHDAESDQAGEFEPGDILVCRITDPSWAPMLSVAAAVVIDIGGAMSHGAIVARELGIPCVINTKQGTQLLRNGDKVEVDGTAGTVTLKP